MVARELAYGTDMGARAGRETGKEKGGGGGGGGHWYSEPYESVNCGLLAMEREKKGIL